MKVVHCINLPERKDRRQAAQAQAAEQGFHLNFWEGIKNKNQRPHTNISRAHKQIVQRAKETKLPSVIIMEDDCLFTHPKSFQYYIKNMPRSYHLYMGLIYSGTIHDRRVVSKFSGGMTLYTVHHTFYDTFLSADETDNIDRWCGSLAMRHNFYVCKPMVVRQQAGHSDHFRRFMSYEGYERTIDFYQGE